MARCPVCGEDNAEPARFCSACGRPLSAARPQPETRKTVTVLFADVTGSTALGEHLDPEALRALIGRYFATMKRTIERHGGTVEKFIGDAVMAVFGIPHVHEDDALRAVRAAAQIRDELAALNAELTASRGLAIQFRTGVFTGEVVAGDPSTGQTLVTGDTVNTAARLEQAAPPGEILIGRATWALVRDAVDVEAVDPVAAKGKAEPVAAFRLVSVRAAAEGRRRRHDIPLVGREADLARLVDAYRDAVAARSPRLVTVIGAAGVGKSRLVAELRAALGDEAMFLKGRCLSYGTGITYWPIGELVREAAGIEEADDVHAATARIRELVAADPNADVITARVASAIGLSDAPAAQEELFWAIRRILERLARRQPVVVVIEDVHWAEPTLLELVEHLATRTRDAALLLVCPARPELLETHADWAAGAHIAATIRLDALPADAMRRLIAALPGGAALPARLRDRVEAAGEGNPLYIEELLGMLIDDGLLVEGAAGSWQAADDLADVRIPTSISTLLAARLERLAPGEHAVVGPASVVGRVFEQDAVETLSAEAARASVPESLRGLVRKELVRPDRSELVAGDAFRFRHVLIRDAAYAALAKADRADLHEGFVAWLDGVAGDRRPELEEIVGYHLSQASRYRRELGDDDGARVLGARAAGHLAAAARRAEIRGDDPAAENLLRAALALPVPDALAVTGRLRLATLLAQRGLVDEAVALAAEGFDRASAMGDLGLVARSRVTRLEVDYATGRSDVFQPQAIAETRLALDEAGAARDHLALSAATVMLGQQAYMNGGMDEAVRLQRLAADHARRAGDELLASELELVLLTMALVGPTPAAQVAAIAESWLRKVGDSQWQRADVVRNLAIAEAMLGRHDIARAGALESVSIVRELGQVASEVFALGDLSWVYRLGGDPDAAEDAIRQSIDLARGLNDRSAVSWGACRLAQVLAETGRLEDAEPWVAEAELVPMVMNRTRVLGIRARIRAGRGEAADARRLVDELITATDELEMPNIKIDGFVDAAEATALTGDHLRAERYATEALRLAEAKGNVARAAQVQAIIDRERAAAGASAPATAQ